MKPTLPLLLSVNAGYVDTAGFLALHGLFTAHVTGNFVTLGAALVLGTSGIIAKVLALPMFCLVLVLGRLLHYALVARSLPVLRTMLLIELVLLIVGAALAIRFGPFPDSDTLLAVVTGLVLVAAMAIQNGLHKVHLGKFPPSTLMTGTTTQIMLDLGDKLHGVPPEQKDVIDARLSHMAASVGVFAVGCAMAALLYAWLGMWCFALPPVVAFAAWRCRQDPEPMVS